MGRTYSFEPFRSQQPAQTYKGSGPRLGNDESKTTLARDEEQATLPLPSTHHGQQAHAETVKRYRQRAQTRKQVAAKAPAPQARPAAKKAATKKVAAKKVASTEAPKPAAKAPARKSVAAPAAKVASLGRKVLSRAAAAAKTGVARVVKKATSRKPAKKR